MVVTPNTKTVSVFPFHLPFSSYFNPPAPFAALIILLNKYRSTCSPRTFTQELLSENVTATSED